MTHQLVSQYSAVVPGMQNAESIAFHKNHNGLCRFRDGQDRDFKMLASHLSEMANDAPLKVAARWERHEQPEGTLLPPLTEFLLTRLQSHSIGSYSINQENVGYPR